MNEKNKIHYKAVFISDTHLGFRGAQPLALLSFLKSIECDKLYLVGDILDVWEMKTNIHWDDACSEVVRRLLKMAHNGTKLIYLPGNHDEVIRQFLPITLSSNIEIVDQIIHVTSSGDKFAVIHGDQYDAIVSNLKWLAIVGSKLYDWLITANGVLHKVRTKLGYSTYWSLAGYLKQKAKNAVNFISSFETALIHHAKKLECDGVICGHIHMAKITNQEGMIYANCGDWVESLTAICEDESGQLKKINWHDINHHKEFK